MMYKCKYTARNATYVGGTLSTPGDAQLLRPAPLRAVLLHAAHLRHGVAQLLLQRRRGLVDVPRALGSRKDYRGHYVNRNKIP